MNLPQVVVTEVERLERRAEVVCVDPSEAVLTQIQMENTVLHDGNSPQHVVTQVDGGKPPRKRRPSREVQVGEIQMSVACPQSRIDHIDDFSDIGKVKGMGIETSHFERSGQ